MADERLSQALRVACRGDITVRRRIVGTDEEAAEAGFIGSPAVRVDGVDPFASGDEQVGLACRIDATPEGFSGSPTVKQLIQVQS